MIFKVETPWGGSITAKEKYPKTKIFIKDGQASIVLNTLEELCQFQSEVNFPVILEGDWLEIYDESRE